MKSFLQLKLLPDPSLVPRYRTCTVSVYSANCGRTLWRLYYYATKTYGGVEVKLQILTPRSDEAKCSASCSSSFTPATRRSGDWVSPTVGLNAVMTTLVPAGNRTPVVQSVALVATQTEECSICAQAPPPEGVGV
jgi:hypothetical protein